VVATCYLLGVSTRRMEKLVDSLGITRLSKSQVSVMARDLDEQVAAFRTRPLDGGPYTFVAADALVLKVREGGRVVGVHAMIATGVNADGHLLTALRPRCPTSSSASARDAPTSMTRAARTSPRRRSGTRSRARRPRRVDDLETGIGDVDRRRCMPLTLTAPDIERQPLLRGTVQ